MESYALECTSILCTGLLDVPSSRSCIVSLPKSVREERSAGSLAVSSRGKNLDSFGSFLGPIFLETNNWVILHHMTWEVSLKHTVTS